MRKVYFFFTMVLIAACTRNQAEECIQSTSLLPKTSEGIVNMDYGVSSVDFLDQIKAVVDSDFCGHDVFFKVKLSNQQVYTVSANETCDNNNIYCGIQGFTTILLHPNPIDSTLLVGGDIITPSKLLTWEVDSNNHDWRTFGFSIRWDAHVSPDHLNEIFSTLNKKYYRAWDHLAQEKYGVAFTYLQAEQIKKVKEEIPNRISIATSLPLPPPTTIDIIH